MKRIKSLCTVLGVLFLYFFTAALLISFKLNSIVVTLFLDIVAAILIVIWRRRVSVFYQHDVVYVYSFFVILCVFLFVFLCGQFTGTMVNTLVSDNHFKIYQTTLKTSAYITVLLSFIIAPISEECLMRGFVYPKLCCAWSPFFALFVQALLFSIMHGTVVHAIPTFMAALFFGMVYELTNSLKWPILFHAVYNFCAAFAGGIQVPDVLCSWWFDIPLDIFVICIICIMFKSIIQKQRLFCEDNNEVV